MMIMMKMNLMIIMVISAAKESAPFRRQAISRFKTIVRPSPDTIMFWPDKNLDFVILQDYIGYISGPILSRSYIVNIDIVWYCSFPIVFMCMLLVRNTNKNPFAMFVVDDCRINRLIHHFYYLSLFVLFQTNNSKLFFKIFLYFLYINDERLVLRIEFF